MNEAWTFSFEQRPDLHSIPVGVFRGYGARLVCVVFYPEQSEHAADIERILGTNETADTLRAQLASAQQREGALREAGLRLTERVRQMLPGVPLNLCPSMPLARQIESACEAVESAALAMPTDTTALDAALAEAEQRGAERGREWIAKLLETRFGKPITAECIRALPTTESEGA